VRPGPRLSAISELVRPGDRIADIGTDHGWLVLDLLERDIVRHAIAIDRAARPLANAAANLARLDRTRFELRRGDGLQPLSPREVETVVLAGLGGARIGRLLDAAPAVVATLARIVVQPERDWIAMRRWVAARGFALVDERLVADDGRFRLVCAIDPTRADDRPWTEADLAFGRRLRVDRGPTWRAWMEQQRRAVLAALGACGERRPDRAAQLRARAARIAVELTRWPDPRASLAGRGPAPEDSGA